MRILLLTWACDLEDVSEPEITAKWVTEISKENKVTILAVSKPDRFGCVKEQFPDLEVFEWKDIAVPRSLERFRAIVKPGYFSYYIRARRFLRKLLSEQQFDVIHHLSPFAWRYPSPAAGLGVPFVRGPVAGGLDSPPLLAPAIRGSNSAFMMLRRTDRLRAKHDPILRNTYEQADHVLIAAPYMKDRLQHYSIRSWSTEIEHALVKSDNQTLATPKPSDGIFRLVYVGRIIRTKGLLFAIRALSRAKNRNSTVLTVLGDGEDATICREEARRLGINQQVHFLGWRDRDEVQAQYRQADAFIFPSFREPTGGVLLEAMAAGLPVITCAYGGPDFMIDESCGIKVKPGHPDDFIRDIAQAIDHLAESPQLCAKMSKAALNKVANELNWNDKRKRINNIYTKLTSPPLAK